MLPQKCLRSSLESLCYRLKVSHLYTAFPNLQRPEPMAFHHYVTTTLGRNLLRKYFSLVPCSLVPLFCFYFRLQYTILFKKLVSFNKAHVAKRDRTLSKSRTPCTLLCCHLPSLSCMYVSLYRNSAMQLTLFQTPFCCLFLSSTAFPLPNVRSNDLVNMRTDIRS